VIRLNNDLVETAEAGLTSAGRILTKYWRGKIMLYVFEEMAVPRLTRRPVPLRFGKDRRPP
jgi:hypothetical protein